MASVLFLDVVSSDDTTAFEFSIGNVGLSVAPEAHEDGWPRIADGFVERS